MATKDSTVVHTGGIGIFSCLGIIFVTLKLLGVSAVAAWSWWLVLLPFYGPLLVILGIGLVAFLCITLVTLCERWTR